jgi:hypothetical protein
MRFKVRVSPITTKPAKIRRFMPKRISLASTALALSRVLPLGDGITAFPTPRRRVHSAGATV